MLQHLRQLSLDWLGLVPLAPGPAGPAPAVPEPAALPPAPSVSKTRLPTPLTPSEAALSHPQANRFVRLGLVRVGFALKRVRRRSIGFLVGTDGLVVRAPSWVPLVEIDRALHEKTHWILRKLDEQQQRRQRLNAQRIEWREAAEMPFLGQPLRLLLEPAQGRAAGAAELQLAAAPGQTGSLQLALPQSASESQIRAAVQAWLIRQAQQLFTERLQHFAPQLGVQWRKLALTQAQTRWGSAKSDGTIRLNWRLLHGPMSVIDYVVVHELSHLRVMDHSAQFWDTVRSVLPDYSERRQHLRQLTLPSWPVVASKNG